MPWYDRDVGGTGEAVGILNVLNFGDPFCELGVVIVRIYIRMCHACGNLSTQFGDLCTQFTEFCGYYLLVLFALHFD